MRESLWQFLFAGNLRLSPSISAILAQFTLEMRGAAQNREKFTQTPYFGSSGSFKVIDVDISKKLVASACYDKQHVCVQKIFSLQNLPN